MQKFHRCQDLYFFFNCIWQQGRWKISLLSTVFCLYICTYISRTISAATFCQGNSGDWTCQHGLSVLSEVCQFSIYCYWNQFEQTCLALHSVLQAICSHAGGSNWAVALVSFSEELDGDGDVSAKGEKDIYHTKHTQLQWQHVKLLILSSIWTDFIFLPYGISHLVCWQGSNAVCAMPMEMIDFLKYHIWQNFCCLYSWFLYKGEVSQLDDWIPSQLCRPGM